VLTAETDELRANRVALCQLTGATLNRVGSDCSASPRPNGCDHPACRLVGAALGAHTGRDRRVPGAGQATGGSRSPASGTRPTWSGSPGRPASTLIPVHRIDKVTSGCRPAGQDAGRARPADPPVHRADGAQVVPGDHPLGRVAGGRHRGAPAERRPEEPGAGGRAPRGTSCSNPEAGRWSVPEASVRPRSFPSLTTFEPGPGRASGTPCWRCTRPPGAGNQIRVHLAWIGHPIAGDPLFPAEEEGADGAVRTCLHAWRLSFDDSRGGAGDGPWPPRRRTSGRR